MKPHKKLIAWQKSFELVKELYLLTDSFPPGEKFGIISQIRRAPVSIPTNIAEGATRRSGKEFIQFLYIAAGSASELDTLLLLSRELSFCSASDRDLLLSKLEDISKMLFGLIASIESK